ncbi:putative 2-dehydro-3-deoxygluconokinase [Spiroplasma eriocheiris CCTCC M 207170]|nr:putative 2-dehydro-3-deoxygluconokinase [Spiroplasma eriocheiris CCTCC M 207170]
MLRLTTKMGTSFEDGSFVRFNYGGAEMNVGINLAGWDNEVYAISQFPENQIGNKFKKHLNSFGVKTNFITSTHNSRIGLYYLSSPTSIKNGEVTYDRNNSAFWSWNPDEETINKIVKTIDHLHLSGITLALNQTVQTNALKLIQAMQKNNKTISFDFNYRANLWTIQEAQQAILTILPYVDYAFCGHKDLQFILNLIVNNSSEDYQLELQTGWQNLMAEFPNLKLLACTKREVKSPQDNILTGFLYANNKFYQTTPVVLHNIIDRIGGGDAFASGILQGVLNGWEDNVTLDFALANSVLKHTMYGDHYSFTIDEIKKFITQPARDVTR